MIVKLLTERHLEFLSLKGGCTGSSESTLVKMSNCWKSHATPHIFFSVFQVTGQDVYLLKTGILETHSDYISILNSIILETPPTNYTWTQPN